MDGAGGGGGGGGVQARTNAQDKCKLCIEKTLQAAVAAARAMAALKNLSETSRKRMDFVKQTYSEIFESTIYRHIDVTSHQLWSLFPVQFKSKEELTTFSDYLLSKEILSKSS